METEDLKILLALEPSWTVSINNTEFLPLQSSDIEVTGAVIRFGKFARQMTNVEWLRPNIVRIRGRQKFRTRPDTLIFYPGGRLPSLADARRRRRGFQTEMSRAVAAYCGARCVERESLFSDKRHGIGGAYPRFLAGARAFITVDPNESSAVVNGIMRAAVMWSAVARRPLSVIIPQHRRSTIVSRLRSMPACLKAFEWLQWNGEQITALNFDIGAPETRIQKYIEPDVAREVARICALAPGLLQAVPNIARRAVSIRLRGLEIACVTESDTSYPLGEPLADLIDELTERRRYGSRHPLARAHEERWLESNLICHMKQVLPWARVDRIYPQVPSFIGEERNIVDLLTITEGGRLVVIEIKASADPDLPFQAFDYWLAVERHRQAGDFNTYGYFHGVEIRDEPALLVVAAPLLAFHKTFDRLAGLFPADVPLMQVGIHHGWKKEIKILRRKGLVV